MYSISILRKQYPSSTRCGGEEVFVVMTLLRRQASCFVMLTEPPTHPTTHPLGYSTILCETRSAREASLYIPENSSTEITTFLQTRGINNLLLISVARIVVTNCNEIMAGVIICFSFTVILYSIIFKNQILRKLSKNLEKVPK